MPEGNGVIRTAAGRPLPTRIRDIYEGIVELIERHRPSAVSIEDVFHGKNSRTALSLGHARGAILLAASLKDLPISEYTAVEIKKAVTGTGRATKDQVDYYIDLFQKVRQTDEWKKLMNDGAFNAKFMTGADYTKWVTTEEKRHEELMKAAGWIAK